VTTTSNSLQTVPTESSITSAPDATSGVMTGKPLKVQRRCTSDKHSEKKL